MVSKSQSNKVVQMPDLRSTLLTQEHLTQGLWKRRHLDAIAEDSRTRAFLLGMLDCSNNYLDGRQALAAAEGNVNVQQQEQRLHMKNIMCLCNAGCPDEARAWARCVRKGAKALKAGRMPEEMCDVHRRRLERCMQQQTSLMLQIALVPGDPIGQCCGGPSHLEL